MINKLIYKYYDECNFVYDGTNVKLSDEMIRNINTNWEELIASGKEYTNGELYTVSNIF